MKKMINRVIKKDEKLFMNGAELFNFLQLKEFASCSSSTGKSKLNHDDIDFYVFLMLMNLSSNT